MKSLGSLLLTQSEYIWEFLTKTNMIEAKPIVAPMVAGCKLSGTDSDYHIDATLSFLWLVLCSMTQLLNKACQFLSCPLRPIGLQSSISYDILKALFLGNYMFCLHF